MFMFNDELFILQRYFKIAITDLIGTSEKIKLCIVVMF